MGDIYPGRCIVLGTPPHLWIALTEPEGEPPTTVVVNLTSLRENSDTTVVLNVGDHRFIKHETVVSYADATLAFADPIVRLARMPGHRFHEDCSPELLKRIKEGLLTSRFTPKGIKRYCAERF